MQSDAMTLQESLSAAEKGKVEFIMFTNCGAYCVPFVIHNSLLWTANVRIYKLNLMRR